MKIKRMLALALTACTLLAALPALGEGAYGGMAAGMITADMAFTTPSDEFSPGTAWYVLTNFVGQDADGTAQQLENAGLTVVKQVNYEKPLEDHSHTSAYTLAAGEMTVRGETRNVAVVTIRGTGDGEWYSNFDFAGESQGNCLYAENFMAAADAIYADVIGDIAAMDSPVVIVTGYSRGAACANLLGVTLNYVMNSEDLYVYTYATPATVRGELEGHGNIFNLVNVNDAITRMPLEVWGFSRAGVDIELREAGYVNTGMHIMFMNLLGVCPDIDSYYNDRHALDGAGLSEDGMTMCELFMMFADLMSGDEALTASAQQKLAGVASAQNDFSAFLPAFLAMLQPGAEDQIPPLFAQHMPGVYMQLMTELVR